LKDGYRQFRDDIVKGLNDNGVKYKLFGGVVVSLIDEKRETEDLDIFVEASIYNVDRFINALMSCGFCEEKLLAETIYGNGEKTSASFIGSIRLDSDQDKWLNFHLDLCYEIGKYNYDTVNAEEYWDGGVKLIIVPFLDIAKMKANVHVNFISGPPRQKDIEDIQAIAKYLGLDPATGKPVQEESGFKSFFKRIFSRGN
jgi:predicted nucleotidyltransferase